MDNKPVVLAININNPALIGTSPCDDFQAVCHELATKTRAGLAPWMVEYIGTRGEMMQTYGIQPNAGAQLLIAKRA